MADGRELSDFRSDTVTRPSPAMRAAMLDAAVGDDVLDGDPTVGELERRAAAWLGKHGALYVPSGTMANQVAVGAWTRPGDQVVVEQSAHVVCWEAGAAASNHGVQPASVHAPDGRLGLADIERALGPDMIHSPPASLICTEQTFTGSGEAGGGYVVPLEHLESLREFASARGLRVHMDGARLAHAQVASGIPAARWAATADSVSVCLSKGLGAPVGSIVAGDEEFLVRAKLVRKRLGGWMRQAGLIAAGGLYALEHNVERLAEDHRLAQGVAAALHRRAELECPPESAQTNIVMARVVSGERDAAAWCAVLEQHGILTVPWTPTCMRFVTHMDVGPDDLERLEQALEVLA